MFWFWLAIIFTLLTISLGSMSLYYCIQNSKLKSYERTETSFYFGSSVIIIGIGALTMIIMVLVGTGDLVENSRSAASAEVLITQVSAQRDTLLESVEDSLSTQQYAELMAAVGENVDITILLGADTSTIMVEKANKIVELNTRVYNLENERIDKMRFLCDNKGNVFFPRLPWGIPDCKLDIQY